MKNWVLIKNGDIVKTVYQLDKPTIHENKGIYYEQVFTEQPEITATQKLNQTWIVVGDQYVQSWEVVEKTDYEIAIEGWHFPEYPYKLRIKVNLAIVTDPQVQQFVSMLVLWWSAKKDELDHTSDNEYLYFYCDNVLPEHESIINLMSGVIEIESRPKSNTN